VSISQKIEEMMKLKNISRYKLAKETGIPYTTLTNILLNKTKDPQVSALQTIADYFDKPLDYFTGDNEQDRIPEWANDKDIRDFKKMLEEDTDVMFDGVPIKGEDRERVIQVLEALFWDAKKTSKEKFTNNRYKKGTDNND